MAWITCRLNMTVQHIKPHTLQWPCLVIDYSAITTDFLTHIYTVHFLTSIHEYTNKFCSHWITWTYSMFNIFWRTYPEYLVMNLKQNHLLDFHMITESYNTKNE